MAYPKPLSEKSLEKLYKEAKLSDETRAFLHDLFAACANLYGAIPLRDLWNICKNNGWETPKLRRKDLVAFSAIVRREAQPYCIYELDELYELEPREELGRYIISKDLLINGYNRFYSFYQVLEASADKPYYIPEDLLAWKDPLPSEEQTVLLTFLNELESTADSCVPKHGKPYPNENKGRRLKEFSFLTKHDQLEIELRKRAWERNAFLEEISGNEAEKLLKLFVKRDKLGIVSVTQILQYMVDELNEVGVELDNEQAEKLVQLTMNYHNHHHLWTTSGWTPSDLAKAMYLDRRKPVISLGPGYQKAFANGSLDRDEVIRELRAHGFEVEE